MKKMVERVLICIFPIGIIYSKAVPDYTVTRMYYPTLQEYIGNNMVLFVTILVCALVFVVAVILALVLRSRKKMMALLIKSQEAMKNITDSINGGVITLVKNETFQISYANEGFLYLVGMNKKEYEKAPRDLTSFIREEDKGKVTELLASVWDKRESLEIKFRIRNRNGYYIPVLLKGTISRDVDDRMKIFCVLLGIQREENLLNALEDEKEMYRIFMDESRDVIFYIDWETRRFCWPTYFEEKFGYQPPEVFSDDIFSSLADMTAEEDIRVLAQVIEEVKSRKAVEGVLIRLKYANNTQRWFQLQVKRMEKEGKLYRLLGKLTDVDKETRRIQKLSDDSMRDNLTGLYSKNAFYTLLSEYMETKEQKGVLLFVDLDNFKDVNDKMGHLAGDEILQKVAASMKGIFRSEDIVARFGGDEFVVFAKDIDEKTIVNRIQRFREEIIRIKKECHAEETGLSACIGASVYPADGRNMEMLVKKADTTMYQMKQSGKDGFAFYIADSV